MKDIIEKTYGNILRVRACGVLIKNDSILLVKHEGIGEKGYLWAPPGGGVDFGESVKETIKREFIEECNLQVEVEEFLYFNELINPPLHAIELFFKVKYIDGKLQLGKDPETTSSTISDVRYFSKSDIHKAELYEIEEKIRSYIVSL